ncbi:LLM class F420-dependent oxidoreductase [Nocardia goodfellowii]|uniref:F420-dependent oxidoreductase-like protein n=1 Tax=Nocardia goodfellowii TaxID=882446 RepID=A0ABS4QEF9_9NOCA|nr:LLM class F420-dependent oxidoreductase [Nocardia goodfellowii]MBP2190075.1 F420-dependent oxidoreductase-like protein [Nocardia goodfellowii]
MTIRLGYQMPNFSYGQPVRELFPTVVAQAREAEAAGFDTVFVMDHFYQLPGIGSPDQPMLESYTTLGALAASTDRIQLSALVTGNTYRNPALLAKTVTTLDVVSGGRAVLGIGAGWFELEHKSYGFEFGTFSDRFRRLDEALQIIHPMLRGERPTFTGEWYHTDEAMNEPRIREDLPILLGGGGEKKTFALAARYADHLNIICNASDLPRKMDALHQRCAEIGRDPETLEVSYLAFLIIDEDGDRARKQQQDLFSANGVDLSTLSEEQRRQTPADRQFAGAPDEVVEQLRSRVLAHGVQGLIVNMVTNGHEPGAVDLAGRTLAPLLR